MFTPEEKIFVMKKIKLMKNNIIKCIYEQSFEICNNPEILMKYVKKLTKGDLRTIKITRDYKGCRIEPFALDDDTFKYLFRILVSDGETVRGFYSLVRSKKTNKYYLYCLYSYDAISQYLLACEIDLEPKPVLESTNSNKNEDIEKMEEIRHQYNLENYINGNSFMNVLLESDTECKYISRLDDIKSAIKRMDAKYINNLLGQKFTTDVLNLSDGSTSLYLTKMSDRISNIRTDNGDILTMIIIDDWTYLCAKDLSNNQLVLIPLSEKESKITMESMLLLNLIPNKGKSVRLKRVNFNGSPVDENEIAYAISDMKKK